MRTMSADYSPYQMCARPRIVDATADFLHGCLVKGGRQKSGRSADDVATGKRKAIQAENKWTTERAKLGLQSSQLQQGSSFAVVIW